MPFSSPKRSVQALHPDQGVHLRLSRAQPVLVDSLSILKKENHSALVEAYELNLYPTLLVVGPNGTELDRVVGGAAIRDCIEGKLNEIYKENNA